MDSYDLFISHASADKARYVEPLAEALSRRGLCFWLDSLEIGWGDNVSLQLNDGLQKSRFILLCLSRNFLRRPWPETEMGAALSVQNESGARRVLPLILNSKRQVLEHYQILAGLAYREFKMGVEVLSDELARLVRAPVVDSSKLKITVESVHTGKSHEFLIDPEVSIRWLTDKAQASLGVANEAETGAYLSFPVRWVLVDKKAEETWRDLARSEKRRMYAMINSEHGLRISFSGIDRVDGLGIYSGIVFHLYAVEDEARLETDPAVGAGGAKALF